MRRITGSLLLPALDVLPELLERGPGARVAELLREGVDLADRVVEASLVGQRQGRLADVRGIRLRQLLVALVVVVLEGADFGDARRSGAGAGLAGQLELGLQLGVPLDLRVRG